MGHGAGVFGELNGAQQAHIFDALDRTGRRRASHVLAEFLVAEHREAFFERQLKPVLAGDAVARPVVEVFVRHHAFNVAVVGVGGCSGAGEHKFRVEDVQALVFHGPHVEVGGRHNHEAIQIEWEPKAGLVPGDACDQRLHGVLGFVEVARPHVNLKHVGLAGAVQNRLFATHQHAGHQGKQVTRLFERVMPSRKVTAIVQQTLRLQVAIAQQNGEFLSIGFERDGEGGHHVRSILEIGDATKALGLALREKRPLTDVKATQLRVFAGVAGGENFEVKGLQTFRQVFQNQLVGLHAKAGALPIHQHPSEVQLLAVQAQRLGFNLGVAANAHHIQDAGFGFIQVKGEVHLIDEKGWGCVIESSHERWIALSRHGGSPEMNGRG